MHRCAAVAVAWGIPWGFMYRKKTCFLRFGAAGGAGGAGIGVEEMSGKCRQEKIVLKSNFASHPCKLVQKKIRNTEN